jgi:hypothetical protein
MSFVLLLIIITLKKPLVTRMCVVGRRGEGDVGKKIVPFYKLRTFVLKQGS